MRRTLTPSNSPMSSPSKHGDRFIPSRAGANWSINFHRINVSFSPLSCSLGSEEAAGRIALLVFCCLKRVLLRACFQTGCPCHPGDFFTCCFTMRHDVCVVKVCFSLLGKRKIAKSKQKSKGCYIRQRQR